MRKKFYASGHWVDEHLAMWMTMIVMLLHMSLGIAIIVGGIERFSIPSYNPLIYFSNGQTWIWGLWICLSAVLMCFPFRWPNIIGLWLGMVWHLIWTASFALAVVEYSTAAATPIPVYGGLAMICASLLTARVIDKSKE